MIGQENERVPFIFVPFPKPVFQLGLFLNTHMYKCARMHALTHTRVHTHTHTRAWHQSVEQSVVGNIH